MTRQVLMCEPAHFQVEYEINPWMRRANRVDVAAALDQWRGLRAALETAGVEVLLVEQRPGVPDMTFTANAGVVAGRRFLPANFRYEQRKPERSYFIEWFADAGYEIVPVHEPHYWEGEGDVLDAGNFVVAGHRFRTDLRALDHLQHELGAELLRLELVDPRFYHLDTCFCPLTAGVAMWYPPAFSEPSQALIRTRFTELIDVPEKDAVRFACNAVVVDGAVVMNEGCTATGAELAKLGFTVIEAATSEFIKAGGSAKCLALTLDSFRRDA